jgi:hypothetical protein
MKDKIGSKKKIILVKHIEERNDAQYELTKKTTKNDHKKTAPQKESPEERREKKTEMAKQACKRMQG